MGLNLSTCRGINCITWVFAAVLLLLAVTVRAAPVASTTNMYTQNETLYSREWIHRHHQLIKPRGKKKDPKVDSFDGRPYENFNQSLPYAPAKDKGSERQTKLDDLWNQTRYIADFGSGDTKYGFEKDKIFQLWNLGDMLGDNPATFDDYVKAHPDNATVNLITNAFDIKPETLSWFVNSNSICSAPDAVQHRETFEPIDHYNWIAKAHSILGSMNATEQMTMNNRIDNIVKLPVDNLYNLYDTFEIRENMLKWHQVQAAEFFQVEKLTFPSKNAKHSGLYSTRQEIVLKEWDKKELDQYTLIQDSGARYWVPATDSDHTEWASLTRAKIAHRPVNEQRKIRDQAKDLPGNVLSIPDQRNFYESIGINPDGKDTDDFKRKMADILCVDKLLFPARKGKKGKDVSDAPQMRIICDEKQQEDRLRNLFFIERYDDDGVDGWSFIREETLVQEDQIFVTQNLIEDQNQLLDGEDEDDENFEEGPESIDDSEFLNKRTAPDSTYPKRGLSDEVRRVENEIGAPIKAPYDEFKDDIDNPKNTTSLSSKAKRGLQNEVLRVENEFGDAIRAPYNQAVEALNVLKNATGLNSIKVKRDISECYEPATMVRCCVTSYPHVDFKAGNEAASDQEAVRELESSPTFPSHKNEARDIPNLIPPLKATPIGKKVSATSLTAEEAHKIDTFKLRTVHYKHDPHEEDGPCGEKSPESWNTESYSKAKKKNKHSKQDSEPKDHSVFENKVTPSTNQVKQKRYDFMAETSVDLENKTPSFYKCWAAIGEVDQIACHSRWVAKHGKPERTTQSQLSKRKSNPAKEKKKAEEAARKEKHDAMIREMDERMDAHILDIEAQNAAGLGEYAQAHGLEPWYKRLSHKLFG